MGHGREGNIHPKRLGFPPPERYSPGPFTRHPQTPQRSFQRAAADTHATPSPNLAHTGSQGETRGLLSPGHSVALCCQRNCHRKNSRRKWMHALWRVSAFSGVAAPLGCVSLWCVESASPVANALSVGYAKTDKQGFAEKVTKYFGRKMYEYI